MPDIQELTSEVQQLQNSFASWTSTALWLTAVTALVAVGYFVASRIALAKGESLRVKQEELANAKEGKVRDELKDKDKQIAGVRTQADKDKAEAAEKIANANARIAEAQRGAAEEQRRALELPALALANALAQEGIPIRGVFRDTGEVNTDKDKTTIHVMIGSKPLN